MQYSRYRSTGYLSSYFPPGVKWLLITNTAFFLLYFFAVRFGAQNLFSLLGLSPALVVQGAVWQLVTYMFLHDPMGFFHILFNMLALWMFGADLERDWGTKRFLQYYFLCGIGAGLCDIAANIAVGNWYTRTIGASGAIYGLLLAFGVLYPNRVILFNFLFPIKAKYFVMIIGAIAFLSSFGAGGGVSHVAHLGGMLFGYIYLKSGVLRRKNTTRLKVATSLRDQYKEWKMARARRKFDVYMRKKGSDRDRWVH